jgi:catechol 2,3-dioxygenase-like lactoylglutathione lyase family enzyme
MSLQSIDHFELVVSDVDRAIEFYRKLGAKTSSTTRGDGRTRWFLDIGTQQVNIMTPEDVQSLNRNSTPGGGHFCMVWEGSPDDYVELLSKQGLTPRRGPGRGFGAVGEGTSIFINDPDQNSVEILIYP